MPIVNKKVVNIPEPSVVNACAIVVLFHPDADFSDRLHAIMDQFPFVALIDNTPSGAVLPALPPSVRWLRNQRNLGIAAALNQGVNLAIDMGYEWCATFDQDSELLPGYLDSVVAVAVQHASTPVLVGCNYVNAGETKPVHAPPAGATNSWQRSTLITSGTFMPTRFAYAVGGFLEDYFIDSVDHEFCLRCRNWGAKVLMTTQPLLQHRMGNEGIGIFGLLMSLQHNSERRYYIARNTLLTIKKHGTRYPLWALRHIRRLFGEGIAIIFLESDKGPKFRAFARGLWHGLINRSGPLEKN